MKNLKNLILIIILILLISTVKIFAQGNLENAGSYVEIAKEKAPKHSGPRYSPSYYPKRVGHLILVKGSYTPDTNYIWENPEDVNNLEVKNINSEENLYKEKVRAKISSNNLAIFTCTNPAAKIETASKKFNSGQDVFVIVYYNTSELKKTKQNKFVFYLEFCSDFLQRNVYRQEFEFDKKLLEKNYLLIPLYRNLPPEKYEIKISLKEWKDKASFEIF